MYWKRLILKTICLKLTTIMGAIIQKTMETMATTQKFHLKSTKIIIPRTHSRKSPRTHSPDSSRSRASTKTFHQSTSCLPAWTANPPHNPSSTPPPPYNSAPHKSTSPNPTIHSPKSSTKTTQWPQTQTIMTLLKWPKPTSIYHRMNSLKPTSISIPEPQPGIRLPSLRTH